MSTFFLHHEFPYFRHPTVCKGIFFGNFYKGLISYIDQCNGQQSKKRIVWYEIKSIKQNKAQDLAHHIMKKTSDNWYCYRSIGKKNLCCDSVSTMLAHQRKKKIILNQQTPYIFVYIKQILYILTIKKM